MLFSFFLSKNNGLRNVIFLALTIHFFSCSGVLDPDYQIPRKEPKMVIWGVLNPDSVISVALEQTGEPLAVQDNALRGARVVVFEDGISLDTLTEDMDKAGHYYARNELRPAEGNSYYFQVQHSNFKGQLSTLPDTIPTRVGLVSVKPVQLDEKKYTVSVEFENPLQSKHLSMKVWKKEASQTSWEFISNTVSVPCLGNDYGLSAFEFIDISCAAFQKSISMEPFTLNRRSSKDQYQLTLCIPSEKTSEVGTKLGRLYSNSTLLGSDPFFEPVFVPWQVNNGFGMIGCISCQTIPLTF